ncbi:MULTISPECIES: hypothetical protein [unclassified Streptomyces]|uniref:hypothetical protein n=1 Tax=unclassified Streptomyces TaxID=2593676 RepID=UPI001906F8C5|nr:hypothetical protein [Streptomyces sp. HSG2]
MTVDPSDPETFAQDGSEEPDDVAVEAPRADAAEQRAELAPGRDDPLTGEDADRAAEADLLEQARVISLDEDDYR